MDQLETWRPPECAQKVNTTSMEMLFAVFRISDRGNDTEVVWMILSPMTLPAKRILSSIASNYLVTPSILGLTQRPNPLSYVSILKY